MPIETAGDCFEAALETLKSLYSSMQNIVREKDEEIKKLLERNAKLTKAVGLLQRERNGTSSQKRRKTNSFESTETFSDSFTTDDEISCTSKLNMALNSEQLLAVFSPLTEKINNAQILETVSSAGEKDVAANTQNVFSMNLNEDSNNENIIPLDTSEWLIKQHSKFPIADTTKVINPIEKKASLSLSKKSVARAKYLERQLSGAKESSFCKPIITSTAKPNESNVKLSNTALKQTSLTQSWQLNQKKRTEMKRKSVDTETDFEDHDDDDDGFHLSTTKVVTKSSNALRKRDVSIEKTNKKHFNHIDDDDDDMFFDLDTTKLDTQPKTELSFQRNDENAAGMHVDSAVQSKTKNLINMNDNDDDDIIDLSTTQEEIQQTLDCNENTFDLRAEIADKTKNSNFNDTEGFNMSLPLLPSDSSSVVILPQESQEIVFLDDTIQTMELLQCVQGVEKYDLDSLRNIEKRLDKRQNEAAKSSKVKDKSSCEVVSKVSKLAPQDDKNATKDISTPKKPALVKEKSSDGLQTFALKREPESPIENRLKKSKSLDEKLKPKHCYDDVEDLMPKPFAVKKEFMSEETSKRESTATKNDNLGYKKPNYCICEGAGPCVRNCSPLRRKESDFLNTTPEGFWNPLMFSYPESDPRNEILIDNRFVKKKHHN